jgi:hypothetical protein
MRSRNRRRSKSRGYKSYYGRKGKAKRIRRYGSTRGGIRL